VRPVLATRNARMGGEGAALPGDREAFSERGHGEGILSRGRSQGLLMIRWCGTDGSCGGRAGWGGVNMPNCNDRAHNRLGNCRGRTWTISSAEQVRILLRGGVGGVGGGGGGGPDNLRRIGAGDADGPSILGMNHEAAGP